MSHQSSGLAQLFRFILPFAFTVAIAESATAQEYAYWADLGSGSVRRIDLSSGVDTALISGLSDPIGIALDPIAGKVYWSEFSARSISRADLDGTNVEMLIDSGLDGAADIALDLSNGKMYWTDNASGRVMRSSLDGNAVEALISGLDDPIGIAIDHAQGKMYWAEYDGQSISRANLDGSSMEALVTNLGSPSGIALNLIAGKVYWADNGEYGPSAVRRCNLDGTGIELVMLTNGTGSLIALDPIGNRMVYSSGPSVWISDLDGGGGSLLTGNTGEEAMAELLLNTLTTTTPFCDPAVNNSTGAPAVLAGSFGSGVGSDLHLEITGGVPGQLAYFLVGNEATAGITVSNGQFCLVGTATAQFFRYNAGGTDMNSIGGFDVTGRMINSVGTSTTGFGFDVPSMIPGSVPITILSGDTWHFQGWFRDSPGGVGTSNFTNGLSVNF